MKTNIVLLIVTCVTAFASAKDIVIPTADYGEHDIGVTISKISPETFEILLLDVTGKKISAGNTRIVIQDVEGKFVASVPLKRTLNSFSVVLEKQYLRNSYFRFQGIGDSREVFYRVPFNFQIPPEAEQAAAPNR